MPIINRLHTLSMGSKCCGIALIFLFLAVPFVGNAQIKDRVKSEVDDWKSQDPLSIKGSAGASFGYNYFNGTESNATPLSLSFYTNFEVDIYKIKLPFSFYYTLNSRPSGSMPSVPTFTLGVTPTWKMVKFHLGYSSMNFGNYTYSGLSFFGLGAELQGAETKLRAAAFAGDLNRGTRLREFDERSAFQRLADSLSGMNLYESSLPQYRRKAVGAKLGYGTADNFIDFSFLKASDDPMSLYTGVPEASYSMIDSLIDTNHILAPENFTMGVSTRFSLGKHLVFTANGGASLYNADCRGIDTLGTSTFGDEYPAFLNKTLGAVHPIRNNTTLAFAGDAALAFRSNFYNASLTYRFIDPGYTSLGTATFTQNTESFGMTNNLILFKGKTIVNLVGYTQHDNLSKQQAFTNKVSTLTGTMVNRFGQHITLNSNYCGIFQNQLDGTEHLNDTTRLQRATHTVMFAPAYNFEGAGENPLSHTIGLNLNLVKGMNTNPFSSDLSFNVNTLTVGANYSCELPQYHISVNGGLNHSNSASGDPTDTMMYYAYKSNNINYGIVYNMMQTQTQSLNLGYDGSFGIMSVENRSSSLTFSNTLSANFNYNQRHTLGANLSLSNFSNRELIGQITKTKGLDLRFTISYTLTFDHKIIKSKHPKEEKTAGN